VRKLGAGLHGLGGGLGVLDVFACAFLHGADVRAHLVGGVHGLFGQLAHLVGHNGKAAPGIARARGLNGGVKRQQVGLVGDVADDVHDLADALGLGPQFGHVGFEGHGLALHAADGLHHLVDELRAQLGLVLGLVGQIGRGARASGHLHDGGVHLFHGRGRLRRA